MHPTDRQWDSPYLHQASESVQSTLFGSDTYVVTLKYSPKVDIAAVTLVTVGLRKLEAIGGIIRALGVCL
jgi:hypothetical protein